MTYAIIKNQLVTNAVVCDDPEYAQSQGWIKIDGLEPMPWIGWSFDGTHWTPPKET